MTRQELVAAYASGRIDRRAFIRGLVDLGMSVAIAAAYAAALTPAVAASRQAPSSFDDFYGEFYDRGQRATYLRADRGNN